MDAETQKVLEKFLLDKSGSRFTVQAFSAGLLSSFGHNPVIAIRDFDGEIQFVPDTWEGACVRVTLRTGRMDVLDEMKGDDRRKLEQEMYERVLRVEQFPTAEFESKDIAIQKMGSDLLLAHAIGDLSFHGVRRALPIDARVTRMGTMLRISGQFLLRQSDYGIKPVSFVGGTLKLKDELKFSFELVARAREQSE
jgi:polyisoprenoid-binding protein YceI